MCVCTELAKNWYPQSNLISVTPNRNIIIKSFLSTCDSKWQTEDRITESRVWQSNK